MLRGYQSAAPHLILWGAIYAAAYGFGFARPGEAGLAWLVLVPAGVAGDFIIARRDQPGRSGAGAFLILFATLLVFITASAAIMRPHEPRQMAAFVPLLVAACYVVLGSWTGVMLLWTGVALASLTLFGFFALPAYFLLWMAVVGGGGLVLGGFWLRQA